MQLLSLTFGVFFGSGFDNQICVTAASGSSAGQPHVVAAHDDKVIQVRLHRSRLAFASSSADKTVKFWTSH
eukprot:m.711339 g.711339  ORF g.711339 m.711339 type:complete len:71 (-) comp58770_c0_seq14:161-373(-)